MSKAFITKFLLEEKIKAKKNFIKSYCVDAVQKHFSDLGVRFYGFRPFFQQTNNEIQGISI